MSAVRLRRLQSDFARITELSRRHPRIALLQAAGTPPDRYQLRYNVRSARKKNDDVEIVSEHTVEITLPAAYPRTPPLCRLLTPIFHPNIAPHAICIGDHWSPGEALASLVVRIAEMLAFQSYNTKSPLNGEAAKWVELNLASFPLDPANMTLDLTSGPTGEVAPPAATSDAPESEAVSPPPPAPIHDLLCASCGARLRVRMAHPGKVQVRCPECKNLSTLEA